MSLRETLNKNQTAVVVGAIAVVVLAIGGVFLLGGRGPHPGSSGNPKAFYTSDDGKTFFLDDDVPVRMPPFQTSDGKTAYRCEVWSCDGGKTKQVVYLQKWRDDAKKRVEDAIAEKRTDDPLLVPILEGGTGSLVRLPGVGDTPATNWVPIGDRKAVGIMTPNCPAGSAAQRIDPNE